MKKLENIFLSKYQTASIVVRRKSKTLLYFVFLIGATLAVTSTVMVSMSVYGVFSIEFMSRMFLIIIGLLSLVFLKSGHYYTAANIIVIGATLASSLQMFYGDNKTELVMFISIMIPCLFIISAAVLGTRLSIVITGALTLLLGAAAVLMNESIDREAASRIIGSHFAFTIFIIILCYISLKNMVDAMRTLSDEMQLNLQKSEIIVKLLNNARSISHNLASSSNELSASAGNFTQNAQSQASSVEEITASMEEMSAGIDNISSYADSQSSTMDILIQKMGEFTDTILAMKNDVESMHARAQIIMDSAHSGNKNLELMNQSMDNIAGSSGEITGIVNIINDISDQINLLSLNAAIEAARAGDAGRGFAVVADEISKLADRTSQSVKTIGQLISANENEIAGGKSHVTGTVETIRTIVNGVTENFKAMKTIAEKMEAQLAAYEIINQDTGLMQAKTEEVRIAAREHKTATDEIVSTISTINDLTASNSAGSEEILASTEELSSMADELKELIHSIDEENRELNS